MRRPYTAPSFRELVALELDPLTEPTVRHRRSGSIEKASSDGAALTWNEHPDEDLIGLALSGGGIRSATFNLGLLQGLSEVGLVQSLDYVSTVSGGGYVGGFWSAWRARREQALTAEALKTSGGALPFAAAADPFIEPAAPGRAESDGVRHLREFSNFLNPRLGLLTYDTGRLVASIFSSTLPALAAAVSVLVLAVGVWQVFAYGLLGLPALSAAGRWQSLLVLLAVTTAVFGVEERTWITRGERWSWWYVPATLIGLGALALLWMGTFLHIHEHLTVTLGVANESAFNNSLLLLLPAGAWVATAVGLVVLRLFLARAGVPPLREARGALDRVTIRLLALAAGWTVLSTLWVGAAVLLFSWLESSGARLTGFAGLTAALGAAFGLLQRFLSGAGAKPFGGRIATFLKPKLPQLLAYAAVIALMLTVVMGIWWFRFTPMLTGETWLLPVEIGPLTLDRAGLPYALAGLITLVTLAVFNPNEVGLHGFYRSRLARAYLGASNPKGRRQTEERRSDDVRLDVLSRHRPLHLICCAANDLSPSSDHLGNLHRGATSAVLSPVGFSVGSEWAAWPPDDSHVPTLASAMTASGAAFNSLMGSKSMEFGPAVTFLMAALNLRLGLWLPHPSKFAHKRYRLFPGIWFYREMLGQARANGAHVHLSDGGHFENMALYELVRRHCRYIIASDCGADAEVAFDDLGNVVRRVREDFGVEVDIDLAPLRPDDHGRARQAMVAGDVRYPNGDTGVLLVVKPTLTGDEPADIAQYRRRNGAFPHESTGDQFYDEAQWESYRRLGVHCARTAFRSVVAQVGMPDEPGLPDGITARGRQRHRRRWAARVFAGARMRWQPIPPGLESRLGHIVDRAAQLDALLQQPECGPVLREVYKEVDELDRLARRRPDGGTARRDDASAAGAPDDLLRPELLAPSLHAIRRAILFMEEVYLSEQLERHVTHPLYLGITNYFARWAYAPLFRMWWPLMKSLYAHEFTRFVERRFQLAAVGGPSDAHERVLTALNPENEGFAMHCWRLHGLPLPDPTRQERLLSFALAMRYRGQTPYHIQAAQVLVRQLGSAVVWDAEHFFVPPGLWGIGIGGRFLAQLIAPPQSDGPLAGVERLLVRIAAPRHTSRAMQKETADLAQLYRNAEFRELPSRRLDDRTVVLDAEGETPATIPYECDPAREREWWFEHRLAAH
jgi:hypothetical protein